MRIRLKPIGEQVVVITGASSGIGLATAKLAAERGAKVFLIARDDRALRAAVAEIGAAGGTAAFATADVSDLGAVRAAAAAAIERFGRIDTWVNNAGVAIYAKLIDTPMAEHEQLFRTNYFGAVHGALTAVEHLRAEGGALITVASIASDMPSPIMGAYSASKHALAAYIASLRIEIIADALPIAITLIKPSGVATPIAQHAANHLEGEALIPLPVYDPSVVARAIVDAAQHHRRDVTVGGLGRAQVRIATHAPRLLDMLGPLIARSLHDPSRKGTIGDNLARPVGNDHERSRIQHGKRFSIYTAARRHLPTALGVALVGGVMLIGMPRRRSVK